MDKGFLKAFDQKEDSGDSSGEENRFESSNSPSSDGEPKLDD